MRVRVIAAVVYAVGTASPVSAATYHVAPDSSGDVLNIQAAIDVVTSGDEIVLSDGTFTGDGNWDLNFGTKDLVLRSENGYEATIVDGGFDSMHDIRHRGFILEGGQTAATVIEGITIQHCRIGELDGGALRCIGSSPVIRNVRLRRNSGWGHGLGILAQGGSPTIEDCVFENNMYPSDDGEAIFARQSSPDVRRCSFSMAGWGLVNVDGGVLADCTFDGADQDDSQFNNCVRVAGGRVSLLRCAFRNLFGYSVLVNSSAEVLIGSCLFEHNFADAGSGVFGGGAITVRNTTFRNNFGDDSAAISLWGGALTLDGCVFLRNGSCHAPFAGGRSSAVYAQNVVLEVTHCTFVQNRNNCGRQGSAITIEGGSASIDHTIIAFGGQVGPSDGAIHCIGAPASLNVSCTDIFGNDGGDWTGCIAAMDATNGNLSADPLFCDIAAGDLSLQADSPCAPANAADCGLIGALGPWCGPLAVESRSWGSIKALYR